MAVKKEKVAEQNTTEKIETVPPTKTRKPKTTKTTKTTAAPKPDIVNPNVKKVITSEDETVDKNDNILNPEVEKKKEKSNLKKLAKKEKEKLKKLIGKEIAKQKVKDKKAKAKKTKKDKAKKARKSKKAKSDFLFQLLKKSPIQNYIPNGTFYNVKKILFFCHCSAHFHRNCRTLHF
jgi:hypothetical protein